MVQIIVFVVPRGRFPVDPGLKCRWSKKQVQDQIDSCYKFLATMK
jgi:hypothetical protein